MTWHDVPIQVATGSDVASGSILSTSAADNAKTEVRILALHLRLQTDATSTTRSARINHKANGNNDLAHWGGPDVGASADKPWQYQPGYGGSAYTPNNGWETYAFPRRILLDPGGKLEITVANLQAGDTLDYTVMYQERPVG